MFGFSFGEILFISFLALLLFGNEKLPQNIKKFFRGWNQTKKVALDLQKSWYEVQLDLKSKVELLEDNTSSHGEKNLENSEKKFLKPVVKPMENLVSQDEIDSHEIAHHSNHDAHE